MRAVAVVLSFCGNVTLRLISGQQVFIVALRSPLIFLTVFVVRASDSILIVLCTI